MKMYTIDGLEVFVVKKIEEGYLAKQIYNYPFDEDEEDSETEMSEQINFYEKLYDKPLTQKYAQEVNKLISEREVQENELSNIRKLKAEETSLLNKINKFPVLKILSDFLTGDFKFYMNYSNYEIIQKDKIWIPTNVKVINFKEKGWCLYKLRSEHSEGYDDTPFMIFNTIEDAVEFSRINLSVKMQQYKKNEYWGSGTFKDEMAKIAITNPIKKDPKYLEEYNSVLNFLIEREENREAEKLKKEIADLEDKKKKLETLTKP